MAWQLTFSCQCFERLFQKSCSRPPISVAFADNIRRYGEFPVPAIARGGKRRVQWPGVRVKTFSVHVMVVFRPVVSGKRFSTHEESRVVFTPAVKISRFNIGDIDLYPIFVKKKDYAGIVANLWNG